MSEEIIIDVLEGKKRIGKIILFGGGHIPLIKEQSYLLKRIGELKKRNKNFVVCIEISGPRSVSAEKYLESAKKLIGKTDNIALVWAFCRDKKIKKYAIDMGTYEVLELLTKKYDYGMEDAIALLAIANNFLPPDVPEREYRMETLKIATKIYAEIRYPNIARKEGTEEVMDKLEEALDKDEKWAVESMKAYSYRINYIYSLGRRKLMRKLKKFMRRHVGLRDPIMADWVFSTFLDYLYRSPVIYAVVGEGHLKGMLKFLKKDARLIKLKLKILERKQIPK